MEPWNIGGCGLWWGNLRWNLDHGEERGDPIEAGGPFAQIAFWKWLLTSPFYLFETPGPGTN